MDALWANDLSDLDTFLEQRANDAREVSDIIHGYLIPLEKRHTKILSNAMFNSVRGIQLLHAIHQGKLSDHIAQRNIKLKELLDRVDEFRILATYGSYSKK
jgi:hypothetical protein